MDSVYICGILLLATTSFPQDLDHGAGLGGFIGAIILFGFGVGGIKSRIAPFTGIVIRDLRTDSPSELIHLQPTRRGEKANMSPLLIAAN
jgi:dipeptide/tripeptide permease